MKKKKDEWEEPTPEHIVKKLKAMTDDELFDELRMIVNTARNTGKWDRVLAKGVGAECKARGWETKVNFN